MALQRKLGGALLTFGLAVTFVATARAQEPAPAQQDGGQQQKQWEGRRGRHRGMGKRGHGGVMRLFSQLNLTDAQQQQLRTIEERYEATIKPQREEMRRLYESNQGELSPDAEARAQQLRAEMRQAMQGIREEMMAVLTPEQRTQLEQLIKERKARQDERRARRMNPQTDDNDQ